MPNTLGF